MIETLNHLFLLGFSVFFHFLTQKGWVGVIPNNFIAKRSNNVNSSRV